MLKSSRRHAYFLKYNVTMDLQKERISETSAPYNFVTAQFHELMTEITCESVLHIAVRMGNLNIVKELLAVGHQSTECTDFQGLTPLAASIVFAQYQVFIPNVNRIFIIIMKILLKSGANTNFPCKPVDVTTRIFIMKALNIYDAYYIELRHSENYCKHAQIWIKNYLLDSYQGSL